jgi:hypothetical protein
MGWAVIFKIPHPSITSAPSARGGGGGGLHMKICSRSFSVGDPSFSPGSGLSIQQAVLYCIGQEHIGDIRYRPYVHINVKMVLHTSHHTANISSNF